MDEQGHELYRCNHWRNDTAANAAERSIADWMRRHPQYEMDDYLSWKNS